MGSVHDVGGETETLCALFKWVKDPGLGITFNFWLSCIFSSPDQASSVVSKRPFSEGRDSTVKRKECMLQGHTELSSYPDSVALWCWASCHVLLSFAEPICSKVLIIRFSKSQGENLISFLWQMEKAHQIFYLLLEIRWHHVTSSDPKVIRAPLDQGTQELVCNTSSTSAPENLRDHMFYKVQFILYFWIIPGGISTSPPPDIHMRQRTGERGNRVFC